MKKLNQLLIIEAGDNLPPLISQFQSLLASFSETPIAVLSALKLNKTDITGAPELVLFHSNLTTEEHLKQFIEVQQLLPYSSIIIVGRQIDENLCLLALEAGAADGIAARHLSSGYMRKAVLLSLRRSRTEEELRQKREQLLATLQNTPNVAIQWYNSNCEVLFWNHASERIFGWKAEEAVGRTIDELLAIPENKNFWRNKIRHLVKTHSSYGPEEWSFKYADGTECYCVSTLFPIPSPDADPWFVCMDVDITAQKQMEKSLRESEGRYWALLEQQADAIAIFNETGKILYTNPSATDLFQYTPEELHHMTLSDVLYYPETKQDPVRFDQLSKGQSTIKQRKIHRKDGVLIETEVHAKRLTDGIFLAALRDIGRRLEVQQKLEKEIELSNTIINSLPGVFYLFTKGGKYLRWNKKVETITGYSAKEIRNMSALSFFDENERPMVQAAIDETFQKGQSYIEAHLLAKSGKKIPFYFTGIAINYANTTCLLGAGIDLSPLKNLEAKLSQQKIAEQKKVMQAMIDAEENERAKLGLELHDNVNQVLSVVRMYLLILNSDKPIKEITPTKTIDVLDKAIEEIRQLSHRLAVGYKFVAGVKEALQTMVHNIQLTGDFSISLMIDPGIDSLTGYHQKLAIYRIVQEQLNNIIKHAKASEVEVRLDVISNEVVLSIADNGKGFQTSQPNAGLGLNNIMNRAEALNGKMEIESAPGNGCRVTVSFPLTPLS